ncbi:hypothetical protein KJ885_05595 [Patescibacteria group bacterium]|nr:hypothetical protein [Patescibacteria group bacterium]
MEKSKQEDTLLDDETYKMMKLISCGILSSDLSHGLFEQEQFIKLLVILKEMAALNNGQLQIPQSIYRSSAYCFALQMLNVCRAHDIKDVRAKVPDDALARYAIYYGELDKIEAFLTSGRMFAELGRGSPLSVKEWEGFLYASLLGHFLFQDGHLYHIRKLFCI